MAVPFALTGGVYLLYLLGYNFSVAVWVGFIALFGTAVQTGMVMVIYLEEAVAEKREDKGGRFTSRDLREAVIDGALLRLRPKVMTVSTIVAGLAAHHVEPARRRGSDQAAGDAGARRHGELAHPCPDRDARDLSVAARAGAGRDGPGVRWSRTAPGRP